MIKEVIVVEGKEDTRRLKEIFKDIHTIETRGSAIDQVTLDLIRKAQETRGVIIFTDPDYPGQRIRTIINQAVPGCKNAYIEKKKAIDYRKKKVGVEHCTDEDIRASLSNITEVYEESTTVSYSDLVSLGLVGMPYSQPLREFISLKLNIGYNNAKQFYNKVQLFNIPLESITELIEEFMNQMGMKIDATE